MQIKYSALILKDISVKKLNLNINISDAVPVPKRLMPLALLFCTAQGTYSHEDGLWGTESAPLQGNSSVSVSFNPQRKKNRAKSWHNKRQGSTLGTTLEDFKVNRSFWFVHLNHHL